MKVRRLEQAEHGLTRPLYEEVFSEDSKRFIDYYYTEKTKDNQIYVAEEDGGIQAMLHLNPYELNVNGTKKKANYIVAVATRESYRGRGFMKALLETALKDMYREGESFAYLMPAAEAIYTPHGFRTVYTQQLEYCPIGEAGDVTLENGITCQVRPVANQDIPMLVNAENAALEAEGYQVYTLKSEMYYERLMKEYASEGAKLMLYYLNGHLVGNCPYVPEQEEEEAPKIDALRYMPRTQGGANGRMTEYEIQYSLDGKEWQTAATGKVDKQQSGWIILGFEEPVQAKYVRLIGVHTASDQGNDKHMAVAELRARVAIEVPTPPEKFTVTANVNDEIMGTATLDSEIGVYEKGTNATLTAKAKEGYTFVNWTIDGQEVSK